MRGKVDRVKGRLWHTWRMTAMKYFLEAPEEKNILLKDTSMESNRISSISNTSEDRR